MARWVRGPVGLSGCLVRRLGCNGKVRHPKAEKNPSRPKSERIRAPVVGGCKSHRAWTMSEVKVLDHGQSDHTNISL